MKICVYGLWHLGTVTAACLADEGHDVVALDPDEATVARLSAGHPPLFEPGLDELVATGIRSGHLRFSARVEEELGQAEVVWVTFDTPVDDQDRADVESVVARIVAVVPYMPDGALVLISSQLPVGTTRRLEALSSERDGPAISFAYLPENLRLGRAIEAFRSADRVVAGTRDEASREKVEQLLAPFTKRIEWMRVESAEMAKHALNAFLATSVVFINEIAELCEHVGADAKEIERSLRSEPRIGPSAYLSPGTSFAGGTLARDVNFLLDAARDLGRSVPLLAGVRASNEAHREWPYDALIRTMGAPSGHRVAVWGLTYKAGTDTLRRSWALALCERLAAEGADVVAHDPVVAVLPSPSPVMLRDSALDALAGASALVVATGWESFREIDADAVVEAMRAPLVVDPDGYLASTLGGRADIRYVTVGSAAANG